MARTTENEVSTIIKESATVSIAPFIDVATALVDALEAEDTEGVLTAALLLEIEKWLAAHFYSIRTQLYQSKKTGEASATFQGQTAMGLDYSPYGQMAKLLDISGILAVWEKGKKQVSVTWLGLPVSEQTDYEDRD